MAGSAHSREFPWAWIRLRTGLCRRYLEPASTRLLVSVPVAPQTSGHIRSNTEFRLSADLCPVGEDCFYLNAWTLGLHDDRNRPVMVYIYGGVYGTDLEITLFMMG
jgi:hypothetical protein